MVEDFNSKLLSALDANAPTVSKEVTVRHSLPWFTEEICNQKKTVRWHLKDLGEISSTIKLDSTQSGKIQVQMHVENSQKRCHYRHGQWLWRSSKKLYILVTNLTGTFKENPLPEGLSNKELAEQFAEFFITKIKKIRQELDDKGIYSPGSNGNPIHTPSKLGRFMEEEVASIIKLMPSKMYKLDPLPVGPT